MEQITLNDLQQLHVIFRAYRSHKGFGSWFRGQADSNWSLLPKSGRSEHLLPDNRDIGRYTDWKNKAIAYVDLPSSEIECLAIAQHHGLATRLLDWSQNPLVATFFAVNSEAESDGAIYILECGNSIVKPELNISLLENIEDVFFYIPRAISPRVLNQGGMFTIHCPASKEIEMTKSNISDKRKNLMKVIVPMELKTEVLKMLDDYGINESMLFPDLDGLSRFKNWETKDMVEYRKK